MEPWQVLVVLVIALGCAFGAQAIGKSKGRAKLGWWLGFGLGIIGVIVIACMRPTEAAEVQARARQMRVDEAAARLNRSQAP